jgi:ABC-type transport system involved in cytochrome c biogenesis permease subunit
MELFANPAFIIFLIGAIAIIVFGVMLYRSRHNLGQWIPKSIGQLIWYIVVAEIAWFVLVAIGLRPGV